MAENEDQHPVGDKSIIDLLKADYQEIADIKDVYIPIRGWERTGLSIKYRLPHSGKELDAIARKVQQQTPKNDRFGRGLLVTIDTIIALNEGLFVKPPGFEDYVELDPEERGKPLELADGDKLSAIFGWNGEVDSARKVVKKLFADNDISIIGHGEKLQRWLADTKADLTTEIWELGEVL